MSPVVEGPQPAPAPTEASKSPVRKVVAATAGAGVGVATSELLIGLTDDLVYRNSDIPGYLTSFLTVVVPMLVAGLAGYYVKRAPGE